MRPVLVIPPPSIHQIELHLEMELTGFTTVLLIEKKAFNLFEKVFYFFL